MTEEIACNSRNDSKSLTCKLRENPWILATVVLGVLVLFFLFAGNGMTGASITGMVVEGDSLGTKVVAYLNSQTEGGVELASVADFGSGLYEVNVEYQGQNIPVYATVDGKYLVQGVTPLVVPQGYSEEDLVKLSEFSSCLAENGVKIYGANWCGWTKKLVVDTLGGFDIVGDAYVECTEETELCSSEGITGYPTIKINGEDYSGERTLESLGEATGCLVPELSGSVVSSSSGSC